MAPGMHVPVALQVEGAATFPLLPTHAAGPQTVPAAIGEQVPSWPAIAQDWQGPQVGDPQQKPSVHAPLMHWAFVVQAAPFRARSVHEPD